MIDTNYFKTKLLEEKAVLDSELGRLGIKNPKTGDWRAMMPEMDNDLADPNDRGDRDEEFAEAIEKIGELKIRLSQVERALGKIEANNGTFGICEISQEKIEKARLEANPAARTCKTHINENPDAEEFEDEEVEQEEE